MNRGPGIGLSGTAGSSQVIFGRVLDVIMDANHPQYSVKGQSSSLYGVFYREINRPYNEQEDQYQFFAYNQSDGMVRIPLIGEIVQIIGQPSEDRDIDPQSKKSFWSSTVNFWNHPHHSASPANEEENDFGQYFEEKTEVNPLQAFPGDILIEGRHGNTIRLGGTNFDSNIFSDEDNNGKPYAIIKVGQEPSEPHFETVVEDINLDKSSIYLTSDHKIELFEADTKRLAYLQGEEPELAETYKGAQIILNSDRIFLNAKEDSAFISSKLTIGLNSEKVAIDAKEYIGLDAKRIYLGTNAQQETEPALKGATTKDWLDKLADLIEKTAQSLATTPPPSTPYTVFAKGKFGSLAGQIKVHRANLNFIESKKVYIDRL